MRYAVIVVRDLAGFAALTFWIAGFVLAHGFWSTLACLFPFWAWYLCIERAMQALGIV